MVNLKFVRKVMFSPSTFLFFLCSSYSFYNFYFNPKVHFPNILIPEIEREEKTFLEHYKRERNLSVWPHYTNKKRLIFLFISSIWWGGLIDVFLIIFPKK
jgi:hypothetical protein